MKKVLILFLALILAVPAFSQLKFGIKGGVSTTSISMDQAVQLTGQAGTYTVEALKNANFGYHAGVFLRLKIFALYLQPELLFSSAENTYSVTNPGANNPVEVVQSLKNLSIPVMVGLKFGPVRVNAGPAAALTLGSPKELINDPDLTGIYNKMTFGYQAGVGLDIFKKLTLDVRYEGSLQKYQTKIDQAIGTSVALDNRPNAFIFSLGWMF